MCKRLLMLTAVLLMAGTAAFADGVGVFDNFTDIGNPKGVGSTQMDYVTNDGLGTLEPRYIVTGSGADIWGSSDQFQFAYKNITGDVRLTGNFEWNIIASNEWAKTGVMLRDVAGGAGAVTYNMLARRDNNLTAFQGRQVQDSGSWANMESGGGAQALGIQRLTLPDGTPIIQGIVDRGSGWEDGGFILNPTLPDAVGAGIFVTSHSNSDLTQAFWTNVTFSDAPEFVGAQAYLGADQAIEQCSTTPGFKVHVAQALVGDPWNWAAAEELLETGSYMGFPPVPGTDVTVNVPLVNFKDTGNGAFDNDMSFPGVDPFEQPAGDPAAGDDDNKFGAEINACIHLTPGLYKFGSNGDDGTIMELGGVEILRTEEKKGASNRDTGWIMVDDEGYYSLYALWIEDGGGASLELHQILLDGTRILLGDVAAGGAPVFVPEPATIALLGLGGLALIRRRKGA